MISTVIQQNFSLCFAHEGVEGIDGQCHDTAAF
jgi:hypothetical protein